MRTVCGAGGMAAAGVPAGAAASEPAPAALDGLGADLEQFHVGVQLGVDVGLVPGLERLEPSEDRVVGDRNPRSLARVPPPHHSCLVLP